MVNKLLNGETIAVMRHVNDLKVSHTDSFEVTKLTKYLSTIYREKTNTHRGTICDYLETDLD